MFCTRTLLMGHHEWTITMTQLELTTETFIIELD